jgi:hypothetical protein
MIDGLKLTMTGEELRGRLVERVTYHERRAHWYKDEAKRETSDENDGIVLPERMCEYESERHEWRAEVLAYIREHIEGGEVYRLGEADMAFGELLPEAPGSVQQEAYERDTRIAFNLERLTKELGGLTSLTYALASRGDRRDEPA